MAKETLREQFEKMFGKYDEEVLTRVLSNMNADSFKEHLYSWFSKGWSIGISEGRRDSCNEPYR